MSKHLRHLSGSALFALACLIALPAHAQQADAERASAGGKNPQVTSYLVDKLMLANQAEIELSKIAQEKSSNPEVKQLAQKLIADHTKFDQQLKKVDPQAAKMFAEHIREGTRSQTQVRTSAQDGEGHDALTRLCMINHRAAQYHQNMSKQLLEGYQGQDFDMAFLGMQIGGHTWLISELKALDRVGSDDFQQVVDTARENVSQHLEYAKTLAKKFEDDRRGG